MTNLIFKQQGYFILAVELCGVLVVSFLLVEAVRFNDWTTYGLAIGPLGKYA